MVRSESFGHYNEAASFTLHPVLDPENLLVTSHEHPHIIGKQFEPFVIPCKPTSPKVIVELIREDGEVTILSYNETKGFVAVIDEEVQSDILVCTASLFNVTSLVEISIEIDRRFRLPLFLTFPIFCKFNITNEEIFTQSLYK
jgi:hypothetical protein